MRKTLAILLILLAVFTSSALAQWSTPVRISDPNGCLDPQILAQSDTLHVIYSVLAPFRGLGYIRSTDVGRTWSQEIELSDVDQTMSPIYPRIMAWHNQLLAVWIAYFRSGFYRLNIGYSISSDNGQRWSPTSYILAHNLGTLGSMTAANNDSVVNIIYTIGDSVFCDLRSANFGTTWSQPVEILRMAHTFKTDQAASDSMVHFTWDGVFNDNDISEVYYFRSIDWGLNWSENALISSVDNYISEASNITTDEFGNPAISWWDFKYSPFPTSGDILTRWSTDQGTTWGLENQVTNNHLADLSDISWAQDTIRIAWIDWRLGGNNISIYYKFANDRDGIWSPEERIDNIEYIDAISHVPAITVSNGTVYIVWYEDCCDDFNPDCCGIYFTKNPADPDAVDNDILPGESASLSAYPNPFNSATTITLTSAEQAEIDIYDITGRLITTPHTTSGRAVWDAGAYSSGLYFARLAGEQAETIKLVLIK